MFSFPMLENESGKERNESGKQEGRKGRRD
jgi:hypothetical protein